MAKNPILPREPVGDFRWNAIAGRYVDRRGRFVSRQSLRAALDGALDRSNDEMRATLGRLRSGEISIAEWETAMRQRIKTTHIYSAALSKGGFAQMTPADYGRVGQIVRGEYAYLRRFARQIEDGTQPLDGRAGVRVDLYIQAGRKTYHQVERAEEAQRGLNFERNVLGPADHCSECVALEGKGWVPIGSLPPIGDRECKRNCRCHLEYSVTGKEDI